MTRIDDFFLIWHGSSSTCFSWKEISLRFSFLSNSNTASLAIYLNWRTQKLQEITSDVRASGFQASGGLDLSIFWNLELWVGSGSVKVALAGQSGGHLCTITGSNSGIKHVWITNSFWFFGFGWAHLQFESNFFHLRLSTCIVCIHRSERSKNYIHNCISSPRMLVHVSLRNCKNNIYKRLKVIQCSSLLDIAMLLEKNLLQMQMLHCPHTTTK